VQVRAFELVVTPTFRDVFGVDQLLKHSVFRGSAVAVLLGQSAIAWSQAAPPPKPADHPSQSADTGPSNISEIVIVASTRQSSIDRTSYVIRDTASARSLSLLEILSRLPLVDVNAAGRIRLRGDPNVTILINGREVPDPNSYLRNLQAGQVERVEVATNPSAQLSANGTGGVINIILRRSFLAGLTGSTTATGGSFGAYEFRASPSWSSGAFSLTGGVDFQRAVSPSKFDHRREAADGQADEEALLELGSTRNTGNHLSGNISAIYKVGPRQNLTLTGDLAKLDDRASSKSVVEHSGPDAIRYAQSSSGPLQARSHDFSIEYERDGQNPEEVLKVAAQTSRERDRLLTNFEIAEDSTGAGRIFSILTDSLETVHSANLDYAHPLGKSSKLSIGAKLEKSQTSRLDEASGQIPLDGKFSTSSKIDGSWTEISGYLTYQFPLFGGTLLPGIRIEGRTYSARLAQRSQPHSYFAFPSLHFEHPLTKSLTANLSYSRRVSWPTISELSPVLRFSDPITATAGNPGLRPELTDAYETKLEWRLSKMTTEVTLFSRTTHRVRSSAAVLNSDGVLVTRPVNIGQRLERGASLVVLGSIGRRLSYRISGDVAGQRYEGLSDANNVSARSTAYGASAQIEYQDGTEGHRGADRITFVVNYRGPVNGVLYRVAPYEAANATWSHAITDGVSAVLNLSDLFASAKTKTRYFSPLGVFEESSRQLGPRVNVSVTYNLNSK